MSRYNELVYKDFTEEPVYHTPTKTCLILDLLKVVVKLERAIWCGFFLCLNSLLFCFSVLPLKSLVSRRPHNYLRLLILIVISVLLNYVYSNSRLYHDLKEQDFVKITAAYNMVSISDRILTSYGAKVIENTFSPSAAPIKVLNCVLCAFYVFVHCFVQCVSLTLFEVALNSSVETISLIMITSSFVELKLSVFKKSSVKRLYYILCFDFIDRFQLLMYLFIILVKSLMKYPGTLHRNIDGVILVIFTSMTIDWIKHCYLVYVNNVDLRTYDEYVKFNMKQNLQRSLNANKTIKYTLEVDNVLDYASSVALSFKFVALPHACLVTPRQILREIVPLLLSTYYTLEWALLISGLYILKCLGTVLFLY